MEFKKKSKAQISIPTASLPDIIFMLLIFFMVATVMKQFSGLRVDLPAASKIQKIEGSKRHIANIWLDRADNIVFNDIKISNVKDLRNLAYEKLVNDPQLIIDLKIDRTVEMSKVNEVHQELRKASAIRVNYSAMPGE
jgi:biopolymer transport protein ExbD